MTRSGGTPIRTAVGLVIGFLVSSPGLAQEGPCIVMSEIADAVIESDISIRIQLRDKRIVHMQLDRGCPQLAYHQKFTYQATRGRLCVAQDFVVARSGEFCRIEALEFSDIEDGGSDGADSPGREPDQL